jgi:GDPmannose 4,6-dehydratase
MKSMNRTVLSPYLTPATSNRVAIVTGAAGQDGLFLTPKLMREGWTVHAVVKGDIGRRRLERRIEARSQLRVHVIDLLRPEPLLELITALRPAEIYNLAGQSSVSGSFSDPVYTWQTNAAVVSPILECIRSNSPESRFYQASSTDMFGGIPNGDVKHSEASRLNPQSPYATAKVAAHLLCQSYRASFGLRIACGIMANHESRFRPPQFLTCKIAGHVRRLSGLNEAELAKEQPLLLGNLKNQRDWGFAPDYVEGMTSVLRQIDIRSRRNGSSEEDCGQNYRDYVLGTGETIAIWQLTDIAFRQIGHELDWYLDGEESSRWHARFRRTGSIAVAVDQRFVRLSDPARISVDPTRAREELGWTAPGRAEDFLCDMISEFQARGAVSSL